MTTPLNINTARDIASGIAASATTLASNMGKAVRIIGTNVFDVKLQDDKLNRFIDSSRKTPDGQAPDLNNISASVTRAIREFRDKYVLAALPDGIVGRGLTAMTDRIQGLIKSDGKKTLEKAAKAAVVFNIKGIEYSNKAGQAAASLVHLLIRSSLANITIIFKEPAIADGIATGLAAITRAIVTLAGLAIVAAVDAAVAVTASTLALAGAVTVLSLAVATSPFWASAAVVHKLLSVKIDELNNNITNLTAQLAPKAAEEEARPSILEGARAIFDRVDMPLDAYEPTEAPDATEANEEAQPSFLERAGEIFDLMGPGSIDAHEPTEAPKAPKAAEEAQPSLWEALGAFFDKMHGKAQ